MIQGPLPHWPGRGAFGERQATRRGVMQLQPERINMQSSKAETSLDCHLCTVMLSCPFVEPANGLERSCAKHNIYIYLY